MRFQFLHIHLHIFHGKTYTIGTDNIIARVRQACLLRFQPQRQAHRRRYKVAIQPLQTPLQERKHNPRASIFLADFYQSFFAGSNGRFQNFRNRLVGAHRMISPFGHFLGHRDNRTLRLFRNHPLGIENTILKGLAKLRRSRIMLAQKALAQAAEHLCQNHTCATAGAKDSTCSHTTGKTTNAVFLGIFKGHNRCPYRPQDMGSRHRPGTGHPVYLLIFQQKFAVSTGNHALKITACNNFTISCHSITLISVTPNYKIFLVKTGL